MSKTIYFAGVSRTNGKLNFRTAADDKRMAQLVKLGDTDVEMINLKAENKSQAAKELLARNFANGRADIEALLIRVAKNDNPFARPKQARTVTVKKSQLAADEGKMSAKEAAKVRAEFNARVKAAYEAN